MSTMGSNCTIVVYRCTIIWRTIGQHARNDETRRSVHALVICYFSAVPVSHFSNADNLPASFFFELRYADTASSSAREEIESDDETGYLLIGHEQHADPDLLFIRVVRRLKKR